jgi:hypothetical protein
MINFRELPEDGVAFEQLIREICIRLDLHPQWSGKGPDQGRDIIITETIDGPIARFERRWLVQCKHNAHSGKSVGRDDVGNIVDDCMQVGAEGYLLACTTQPSSALVTKLQELEGNKALKLVTKVWDCVDIEKMIFQPQFFALGSLFFRESFRAIPWMVYNSGTPNKWTGNYKDYFIHLSSRVAGTHPQLKACEDIIAKLEQIGPLGENEYVRPRGIYFDDKHEQFYVFADYLIPRDKSPTLKPSNFDKILQDYHGLYSDDSSMWYITIWDIRLRIIIPYSDHFDVDHYDYYNSEKGNFTGGILRGRSISELARYGDFWPDDPSKPKFVRIKMS